MTSTDEYVTKLYVVFSNYHGIETWMKFKLAFMPIGCQTNEAYHVLMGMMETAIIERC